jgi:DNA-binding MarR family transcriptional regulator
MKDIGMQRLADQAAAVETAAGSLSTVLDATRSDRLPPVSPTQLRVLTIISASPDTNVNRLAEALDVGPSSASRLCDRLEALGLLRRSADPRDRREVRLQMTQAATDLLDELSRHRRRALEAVLGRMPEKARQELIGSLAAFSRAAAEVAGAVDDDLDRQSA